VKTTADPLWVCCSFHNDSAKNVTAKNVTNTALSS
jgi:hypothetical protein